MSESEIETDLELIQDLLDDYGLTPENTIADLIEAINEANVIDMED